MSIKSFLQNHRKNSPAYKASQEIDVVNGVLTENGVPVSMSEQQMQGFACIGYDYVRSLLKQDGKLRTLVNSGFVGSPPAGSAEETSEEIPDSVEKLNLDFIVQTIGSDPELAVKVPFSTAVRNGLASIKDLSKADRAKLQSIIDGAAAQNAFRRSIAELFDLKSCTDYSNDGNVESAMVRLPLPVKQSLTKISNMVNSGWQVPTADELKVGLSDDLSHTVVRLVHKIAG